MNLETITKEDLLNNYSLYMKLLKVMEFVDGKKPEGTCCGKGKMGAIEKFINNREDYVTRMNEIKNRKIKPLFKGALFFTKVKQRFSADKLTDADSLYLIENGYEEYFDMSEYEAPEEETVIEDEVVASEELHQQEEETPQPKKKSSRRKKSKK